MQQPTETADQVREDERRRSVSGWVPVLLVVAVAVAVWAVILITFLGGDEEPEQAPEPLTEDRVADLLRPDGPTYEEGLVVGDTAPLPDGGLARVNGIEPDVTIEPGLPQPPPDTRLYRLDVELCAGREHLFVDTAFWQGLGTDERVHSPHLGVRDLLTITMAPGTCQRGDVDLQLPTGVDLTAVLLMEPSHTTLGWWEAVENPAPGERLEATTEPTTISLGAPAEPETGGSVILHRVDLDPDHEAATLGSPGTRLVRIDGERCADDQPLPASPRHWLVQLADHRLVAPEREGATMATGDLEPTACDRGTADFLVPADTAVVAVIYTYGAIYEEARWGVAG